MNNFSLDDFFAAFKSMRANGASLSSFRGAGSSCCQSQQQYMPQQYYDCPDENISYVPQDNCQGFTCRHTVQQQPQPTCQPQPQPTCQPQPQPTCECQPQQPQIPQRGCGPRVMPQTGGFNMTYIENKNSGIIDGPGNDIYDNGGNDIYGMGNRGIIDTDGNDIYARNYSINTFNTVNNFNRFEMPPAPTPTPTIEPTPTPTITPTPPDPETPDEPTVDLMPLRNLLTTIESINPNGVLEDDEINTAINNPRYSDLDGNPKVNSSEELAIFNKIKAFNEDKDLISNVMKGDYSNIDESTLNELAELSETIRRLAG